MMAFFIRVFTLSLLMFFSFSSLAIYNLKTSKEGRPESETNKHWLLVSEGCHSCSEVLTGLETFCSGNKPPISQIGFFVTGRTLAGMKKKLSAFKADYEIFSGSPNEFYQAYQMQATPSLKIRAKNKSVSGSDKILTYLKKDDSFCQSS